MPAGLLLCALLSAVAVEAANDNHFDRQSGDGRSSHTNLTSRSCAAALAHLHSDMVEAPARRGGLKAVGLGLTWWPLPSRVDLASSAATIDDKAAATATTAQDACGVARQHSRLSDNATGNKAGEDFYQGYLLRPSMTQIAFETGHADSFYSRRVEPYRMVPVHAHEQRL